MSFGPTSNQRSGEQAGQRPVVVLSADVFNERSGTVIAMALTSQERAAFPLTHELKSVKMKKRAWLKISQVRTLSTRRLGRELEERRARDPLERAVLRRRREDRAVPDDVEIVARALGDEPFRVQHDRFLGAGLRGVDLREDVLEIVERLDARVDGFVRD